MRARDPHVRAVYCATDGSTWIRRQKKKRRIISRDASKMHFEKGSNSSDGNVRCVCFTRALINLCKKKDRGWKGKADFFSSRSRTWLGFCMRDVQKINDDYRQNAYSVAVCTAVRGIGMIVIRLFLFRLRSTCDSLPHRRRHFRLLCLIFFFFSVDRAC